MRDIRVEAGLRDAHAHMQQLRNIVVTTANRVGSVALSNQEVLLAIQEIQNVLSLLVATLNVMNGGKINSVVNRF
ncbi:MAG TPA: hypothetical protein VKU01_25690 [Bryobacteraceae bacterium]|nr:hypothetical protein [Bryobacteraceae bacterium]